MFVTNDLVSVTHVFITLTVAVHIAHDHNIHIVFRVYVVVVVGVTAIAALLRLGKMKFNPVMFGVSVASIALLYDAFNSAVCPGMIVGVLVVKIHAEGIFATTCNTHVHVACSILLFTIIVNV